MSHVHSIRVTNERRTKVLVHEEDLLAENRRFGPARLHAYCPGIRTSSIFRYIIHVPVEAKPTACPDLPLASDPSPHSEKCPQSVVAANRRSTTWPRAPADLLFDKLAKSAVHVGAQSSIMLGGASRQRAGKQRSTRRCSMVSPPRRQGTRTRLCHRLCGTRAGNARSCGAG